MNRQQIEACIPHRPPFLWIDEVTDLSANRILARKYLDPQLDVFAGHYPGRPVLPGVLMCEAALQAGAILLAQTMPLDNGEFPLVTRMNEVKFRRTVRPGETVEIDVQLTERLANVVFLTGRLTVDGETAARLEFACMAAAID